MKQLIILYSTGCPKCKVLESKLEAKKIKYSECNDINIMVEKGFQFVPVLEINGEYLDFKKAIDWVEELDNADRITSK